MTSATRPPDDRLGGRLHRLRKERGLSLRALAARSGFSPSLLSQVENGLASPSLSSLAKIAVALDVALGDLFARSPGLVSRTASRSGVRSAWSRAHLAAVAPRALRQLEALVVTLEPGGRSGSTPEARPHEQVAIVLSGEVTLRLSGRRHRLRAGDGVGIPANRLHAWSNETRRPARLALVGGRGVR